MNLSKKEIIESGLIEQYVLNLTNQQESEEVERCAELYPEVKAQINELKGKLTKHCFYDSILSSVRSKSRSGTGQSVDYRFQQREKQGFMRIANKIAILAFLPLLLMSGFLYVKNNNNSKSASELAKPKEIFQPVYQSRNVNSSEQLLLMEALVSDKNTQQILLLGTKHSPDFRALIYWNKDKRQACVNFDNLPPAPVNHQYQMWAGQGNHVRNLGIIDCSKKIPKMILLPYQERCHRIIISLEKSGGSDLPNTEKLIAMADI
jgi:hypothetical protein